MNGLATQQQSRFNASPEQLALSTELAKMLGLVAPVTMSVDQQTLWLASAVEALRDIRANEVEAVSLEIRRTVTSYTKIVPEISRLVGDRRKRQRELARLRAEDEEMRRLPPPKRHIADRDRSNFTADDWAELNAWLESQGSGVRYRQDGTKCSDQSQAAGAGR